MDFKSAIKQSIKWWYLGIVLIIAIDLITKAIFDGKEYGFLSGFISIYGNVHNTGASYGMLSGQEFFKILFIVLAIAFATALICFDLLYKKPVKKNVWYKLAFVLLLGGLFGNLIDRVALGYVRDFIHLDFMSFPVFNIADVALTCGCVAFIIYVLFSNPFGAGDQAKEKAGSENTKLEQEENLKEDETRNGQRKGKQEKNNE